MFMKKILFIFYIAVAMGLCLQLQHSYALDLGVVKEDEVYDMNKDGIPDVFYFYNGYQVERIHADTNYDGKPDMMIYVDKNDNFESAEVDLDDDGHLEKIFVDPYEFAQWIKKNKFDFLILARWCEPNDNFRRMRSIEEKIQELDNAIEKKLSGAIEWQAHGPRCCGPRGPGRPYSFAEIKQWKARVEGKNRAFDLAKEKIKKLKKGMSRQEVLDLFGKPDCDSSDVLTKEQQRYKEQMYQWLLRLLPKLKNGERVLSYSYVLEKLEGSKTQERYGVYLHLHLLIDQKTDLLENIFYDVMIWF